MINLHKENFFKYELLEYCYNKLIAIFFVCIKQYFDHGKHFIVKIF